MPPETAHGVVGGGRGVSVIPPRGDRATVKASVGGDGRDRRVSRGRDGASRDAGRTSADRGRHHHDGMVEVGGGDPIRRRVGAGRADVGVPTLPTGGGAYYQASVTETTSSVLSDESLPNLL